MADPITTTLAIIGASTGVLGAVLGIINTTTNVRNARVRLRVQPIVAHMPSEQRPLVGIRVYNDSAFAVTVTEIGFLIKGTVNRYSLHPRFFDKGDWPRRLD